MTEQRRILVISHGHPDVNPGGGEHAAYALFRELAGRPDVEALFVAGSHAQGHFGTCFSAHERSTSELLVHAHTEPFRFSQRNVRVFTEFRSLLESFRPTVVHLHHYVNLGIELLREIRAYSSTLPVILTLHEYLAICHHNGQMIKTHDGELCTKASPAACHRCFPGISPEDFFLRELYLKSFFSLVDLFVAPSEFLVERYAVWGLPRNKFVCIENGQAPAEPQPARPVGPTGIRGRFGFFGQLSRYKGLDVLFEAMSLIPRPLRHGAEGIRLDVHGANLHWQPQAFQDRFHADLARLRSSVRLHGRYEHEDLPALMRSVDWVVVPSIWWENSPLVIQEAFSHGRPVICADIGGMAEKVRHGVTGLHFRAGSARDLSERMVEAATHPELWDRFRAAIRPAPSISETADRHLELYAKLAVDKAQSGRVVGSRVGLRVV